MQCTDFDVLAMASPMSRSTQTIHSGAPRRWPSNGLARSAPARSWTPPSSARPVRRRTLTSSAPQRCIRTSAGLRSARLRRLRVCHAAGQDAGQRCSHDDPRRFVLLMRIADAYLLYSAIIIAKPDCKSGAPSYGPNHVNSRQRRTTGLPSSLILLSQDASAESI